MRCERSPRPGGPFTWAASRWRGGPEMATKRSTVLVTGGGGYVGAVLVPKLLARGHRVRVIDLFLFVTSITPKHKALELVKGDIRDEKAVAKAAAGVDEVIHLACFSNVPSSALNPGLSRSINYDCFEPPVSISRRAGVRRFVYASTSSVYGVSAARDVTEAPPLAPHTA